MIGVGDGQSMDALRSDMDILQLCCTSALSSIVAPSSCRGWRLAHPGRWRSGGRTGMVHHRRAALPLPRPQRPPGVGGRLRYRQRWALVPARAGRPALRAGSPPAPAALRRHAPPLGELHPRRWRPRPPPGPRSWACRHSRWPDSSRGPKPWRGSARRCPATRGRPPTFFPFTQVSS